MASFNPAQPPRGPWLQADGGCGPDDEASPPPHPPRTPSLALEAPCGALGPESHREVGEGLGKWGVGVTVCVQGFLLCALGRPSRRAGLPLPPSAGSPRAAQDGGTQTELAEGPGNWKRPPGALVTASAPGPSCLRGLPRVESRGWDCGNCPKSEAEVARQPPVRFCFLSRLM